MQVLNYTINITWEELLQEYRHNMTDYLINCYDYIKEIWDRNLLLTSEEVVVQLEVYCEKLKVFYIKYLLAECVLSFTSFVRYTADKIIVPADLFNKIWLVESYTEEYIKDSLKWICGLEYRLHSADFITSSELITAFELDNKKLYADYDFVVGDADGISEEDKKRVFGYCALLDFVYTKIYGKSYLPKYRVRHTHTMYLTFQNDIGRGHIHKVIDWLDGIRVDEAVVIKAKFYELEMYEGGFLKHYLLYENELFELILMLLQTGAKCVDFALFVPYKLLRTFGSVKFINTDTCVAVKEKLGDIREKIKKLEQFVV